ncbi:MAG: hypothetical protein AAGG68_26575 [Bacteroidota bacterium]
MAHTLINQDFGSSIKTLRQILPKLSFGLLIATYLISAIIMGIFHAESSPNIAFKVAAFLVPLAIQTGRGALVFFFQLNPINLQSRLSFGTIAATILLLLSLWEAYSVMIPYGQSWTISVATLMAIGWIIEIMLLRETAFATKWELYQNKELWAEMKAFYAAQREIEAVLKNGTIIAVENKKEEATKDQIVVENQIQSKVLEIDVPKEFYGIELDANNPYLSLNLTRLENRFLERYYQSIQKDEARKHQGKASHRTTLQSIKENKERYEQVRILRHQLLGEELDLTIRPLLC